MKRILCFIDSLGPGGAQRQLVGLASSLKQQGYDVTVAAYHDDRFYVDHLLQNGVPYFFISNAQNTTFRIWFISRFINRFNPDVVIAYLETPSICACFAKLFRNKFKLIVSERSTTQHTGFNEKFRFTLFSIADYIVPNAFSQKSYICTSFQRLSSKIVTIPNFVDVDYFVPSSEKRRREVPEIMVAASIWPAKNTIGFIDAVARLKDRGFLFHVSWYGTNKQHTDYINQCISKIEFLGVGDFIALKEKTSKIKERYQEADFFCLPSFYEGTPNVICEAMASGLPIVCSDVCDNSLYVENGVNGFLFNPRDVSSIADSLALALSLDEVRYQSFCDSSRDRSVRLFSQDKFVQSYIKLIEN